MTEGEHKHIYEMLQRLITAECRVSVSDGDGDWLLKQSQDIAVIMKELGDMDEDFLRVRDKRGAVIGGVALVYGNASDGSEVIADYSMTLEHIIETEKES